MTSISVENSRSEQQKPLKKKQNLIFLETVVFKIEAKKRRLNQGIINSLQSLFWFKVNRTNIFLYFFFYRFEEQQKSERKKKLTFPSDYSELTVKK